MLGGTIRGKLTTLRTPREDDLALVNAWMADLRVRRGGRVWAEPATPATWKERLGEAAKDRDTILWTIEAQGHPVGLARSERGWEVLPNEKVDLLLIDPDHWGRGYGGDAALALHRYLFDYLERMWIVWSMPADDAAGLHVAERLGYREVGRGHEVHYRDGAYADELWLRLDRAAWDERFGATEREYPPLPAGIES